MGGFGFALYSAFYDAVQAQRRCNIEAAETEAKVDRFSRRICRILEPLALNERDLRYLTACAWHHYENGMSHEELFLLHFRNQEPDDPANGMSVWLGDESDVLLLGYCVVDYWKRLAANPLELISDVFSSAMTEEGLTLGDLEANAEMQVAAEICNRCLLSSDSEDALVDWAGRIVFSTGQPYSLFSTQWLEAQVLIDSAMA